MIARGGTNQNEFAKQIRTVERDLLRDHPPIENPRRSTFVNPRPSMNASAFFAMPAKVVALRRSNSRHPRY